MHDKDSVFKIIFSAIVTTFLGGIGFTFKSVINWLNFSNDSHPKNKYKLYSIGGFIASACLLILIIVILRSTSNDTPPPSVSPENSAASMSPTTSPTIYTDPPDAYVEDQIYEGAIYSGYIDPLTGKPNGEGTMKYFNGDKYVGTFCNGIREGNGNMYYANGDTYTGEWKNNERNGEGTYIWKTGGKYIGSYTNNLRNGIGDFIGWTGYVTEYNYTGNYHGMSKDDKFEGDGRFEFDNGDEFVGYFSENIFWSGVYKCKDGSQFLIENGIQQ